jgi:hypothetical protein
MAMLLLTTTDNDADEGLLRYASIGSGRKVLATGTVRMVDLPAGEARVSFYTRTAYFSQIETDKRSAAMQPIHARRLIDGELAFSEPFRARQRATTAPGEGRQNLALAAVAEADYALLANRLPLLQRPFACITAAECALAALLGKAIKEEPVRLLWRRAGQMLGLLVEGGQIHARHAARVEREAALDEATFADRVLPLLSGAANRNGNAGAGRDVVITLALGEWGALPEGVDAKIGAGVRSQLQALFPGAPTDDVAAWPELYGLPFVPEEFNFLTTDYQAEVQGVRLVKPVLWVAGAAAAVFGMAAAFAAIQAGNLNSGTDTRRTALAAKLQKVESQIPKPEDIEKLKRRLGVQSALEGIRLDRFLAWVSKNTPEGVIIRKLEVSRDASPAAPAPATAGAANAAPLPLVSWKAAIEYEVPGPYAEAEKKSAAIMAALGAKSKLVSSALSVKNDEPSRLSINLVTQETVYAE